MRYLIAILGIWSCLQAQIPTQNIRGTVTDTDTQVPLQATRVILSSIEPQKGAITDENGSFTLTDVPVGRHSLLVSYLGYEPYAINSVELNSGKELVLEIQLTPQIVNMATVEITDGDDKARSLNELATVSSRQFSAEETQRYAAALNDPGRMASSFAGVMASSDGRNDIIIRGNSPAGLLWRLQGMDIPNPNHFSNAGSSGGGIAMVSNYLLTNSDFMTGAFPAEYGNALSGVFDLKLRKGNDEEREYRLGLGVLGLDLAGEGPIKKGKSSYLANYRYSTLSFLNALNLPVLNGAQYNYQDLSFHLNFDTEKAGKISLFGMGGFSRQRFKSEADIGLWEKPTDWTERSFGSGMGATGLSHVHLFRNNKTVIKTVLSMSLNRNFEQEDTLSPQLNKTQIESFGFNQGRATLSSVLNHKIDQHHTVKIGFYLHHLFYTLSSKQLNHSLGEEVTLVDTKGNSNLLQVFMQWRYRISNRWMVTAGLHGMHLRLNGHSVMEPRLGLSWQANPRHRFGFGFGQHSQMLPLGTYFSEQYDPINQQFNQVNKKLNFIKARHLVTSYDWSIQKHLRLRLEAYYQHLYSIPVGIHNPALASINTSWNFETDSLNNRGTGRNYGLEFTLEKFFSRNYYFLWTGSIFNSLYTGGDHIERNTRYNGNYAFNLLAGKEFHFGKKNHYFELSGRLIWMGGQRYLPIDLLASREAGRTVYDYSDPFSLQQKNYFRLDLRTALHLNQKRVAHIISFDLQNALNTKNDFVQYYEAKADRIESYYQAGLVPIFAYRLDF